MPAGMLRGRLFTRPESQALNVRGPVFKRSRLLHMHTIFQLKSHRQNLFGQQWVPNSGVRTVMVLIHGHGEHSGRYEHVANYLSENGIAVIAYDHFGHGKSEFKKGHVPSYEAVLDSIAEVLDRAQREFVGLPVFLYGHSLGGNFVANYALRRSPDIRGVILSAPWLRLSSEPSSTDVMLAKVMIKLFPAYTQSTKLDATGISRDAAEVKRYVDDPLVHDRISPVLFLSSFAAGLWALDHAAEFAYPLLLMHGTKDRITSHEASVEFCSRVNGDVTFCSWEGLFHEMHNEPEQKEVLAMMRDWMLERI